MNPSDKDLTASAQSSGKKSHCSLCNLISTAIFIGLGIALPLLAGDAALILAVVWFLGVPMVYLILRYIWLRLCRDPFLSQSDTLGRTTWESITTCPPSLQRTVPTILFWILVSLCFVGAVLSFTVENSALEPLMFISVTFNAFGSLFILMSAIWLVDALCLMYLFVVADKMLGHKGAAQDWWYRNKMVSQDEDARQSLATVARANSEMQTEEFQDARAEKARQLDQNRTGAKWRLLLIMVLYLWWTVWSYFASYDPKILELNVPVPKLPAECDGYKLAMAADLHVGSMAGLSDAQWMVDNLNALNPDVITLVGDIGDRPVTDIIRQKMAPLADLKAPDGVFMSFGNHENIEGVEGYRKLLREESPFAEKIVLLENQHAMLNKGDTDGCSIALIGMADWSGNGGTTLYEDQIAPDFGKAMRARAGLNGTTIENDKPVSSDLPMIMLQHQPFGMKQVAKDGVGLQLSGHTHGGQIWPQHITLISYDGIAGLAEFDVGSEHGPSYLFVSEGVVGWGPRLRFLSRTDIALLTLRTPEAMKAEGLEPDLSVSVATAAMYFAVTIIPISLLLCLVPLCFWVRQSRNGDRRSTEPKQKEEDVEEGKDVPK